MPTYVYETLPSEGPVQQFEIQQRMSEPALKEHPETRRRIKRVPCCAQLGKGTGRTVASHGSQCPCCR